MHFQRYVNDLALRSFYNAPLMERICWKRERSAQKILFLSLFNIKKALFHFVFRFFYKFAVECENNKEYLCNSLL